MFDPTDLLGELNPEQQSAVTADEGPTMVLAGPGSGKTRVLTHRVAYLIGVMGVPPWQVMAVTFTNKAAREMSARLADLVGEEALQRLTIGTFHAICARFLRRDGAAVGIDPRFVIFDDADQLRVAKRALAELGLDDKTYQPRGVLGAISRAKNELLRPEDWVANTYWEEVAGRVYERYQTILRASSGLDFDDLLFEATALLTASPDVRDRYRARYAHVLVDEFQDTNTAQYALVKALAAVENADAPHNLFVVGDEDQSIYSWRGADFRNIQRFRRDFPAARTVLLERNYRSTQTILDAARSVIDANVQRTPKKLWTESGDGQRITLFEAYNDAEEAAWVVREVERHASAGGRHGDLAVMYRTNAQSRVIEDALVRRGIPYQLVGGTRFYARREVKDVVAYLRLVHNLADEVSLERVINVPPRGIGPVAWRGLGEWAAALGTSRWSALEWIAADGECPAGAPALGARTRNVLGAFHDVLADLIRARDELPVPELLDRALQATGYATWLRDGTEEGEERWENIVELRRVAADYADHPPREGLATMLELVALVGDVDSLDEQADRVTLLTMHAAKGLEFPNVLIVGLEEGFVPHSRSLDSPEGLEEERRLFYVGLTRAKRRLVLLHAFRRMHFGSLEVRERSRFLDDIPEALIAGRDDRRDAQSAGATRGKGRDRTAWPAARRAAAGPPDPVAASQPGFSAGDKVRHPSFGHGVVVSSAATEDGDEMVTVAFVEGGVKKLLASFARLERGA